MKVSTWRAVAVTAAAALVLSGCGDDDDDVAAPNGDDGNGPSAEVCEAFGEATRGFSPQPEVSEATFATLETEAPDEISDAAATVASTMRGAFLEEDFEPLESPAFGEAMDEASRYFHDECDVDERVTVTGTEYAFGGLPSELDAGQVSFLLEVPDSADEGHELVILERLEGTDETVEELMALPDDEIFEKLRFVGVAFVEEPGRASGLIVDLEPGEYIAVCNYPVEGDEDDTHAEHGMVQEFTVS